MNASNLDRFASQAADTGLSAALDYAIAQGLSREEILAKADDFCREVRAEMKKAIGPALADARQAVEAGMSGMASATFLASMRLAGIEGAKRVLAA